MLLNFVHYGISLPKGKIFQVTTPTLLIDSSVPFISI